MKLVKTSSLARFAFIRNGLSRKTKVVAVNGCFDVLHSGHVALLEYAATLGDVLVVGVNDDRSVRLLKGSPRPTVGLTDRITVLAALPCVDVVIPFPMLNAIAFLESVKPDYWVKGSDYTREKVNKDELAVVENNGGFIRFFNTVNKSQIDTALKTVKAYGIFEHEMETAKTDLV